MERLLLVAIAGALGAVSRYGLQVLVNDLVGRPTLLGTFAVNMSGSFLLGLLLGLTGERYFLPTAWRVAAAVGFLGAYTTFSTLMFESINRLEAGDPLAAGANVAGSVGLGLLSCYLGLALGRNL